MKAWLKYSLFGLLCYLVFVIIQFPASNAYYFVEDLLDDNDIPMQIYGLNGTVWQGTANTIIYDKKRFEAISWEFHPLDLLMAKASASVRFKGNGSSVKSKVSKSFFGDVIFQNLQANVGAAELIKMLKIPAVKLSGDYALNLSQLELAGKKVQYLQGRLLWSEAASSFPQKLTLGDIYSDFSTSDDGVIMAKLGDGGGPLELSGDVTVAPDGKYDVKGLLSARAGRQSVLGRSLGFIGKYDSKGKASFNKTGNLSEFQFLMK